MNPGNGYLLTINWYYNVSDIAPLRIIAILFSTEHNTDLWNFVEQNR